jgi:hypothetical protein
MADTQADACLDMAAKDSRGAASFGLDATTTEQARVGLPGWPLDLTHKQIQIPLDAQIYLSCN